MGEYTKEQARYVEGLLDGVVRAASIGTTEDTSFNQAEWERHYSDDIIYSDIPAFPSEEAKLNEEDPLTIMDWDHEREIALLVPGSMPPSDRRGSLVFTDGPVVTNRMGEWELFTISDELYRLIATYRDSRGRPSVVA